MTDKTAGDLSLDDLSRIIIKEYYIDKSYFHDNGSKADWGGAHFFYGNRIVTPPGKYIISAIVNKPYGIGSRRCVIEAVKWVEDAPIVQSSMIFSVYAESNSFMFSMPMDVGEPSNIEFRGWIDNDPNLFVFQGINLIELNDNNIDLIQNNPSRTEHISHLTGNILVILGYEAVNSSWIHFLGWDGRPKGKCELISSRNENSLLIHDNKIYNFFVLPASLAEQGQTIILVADNHVRILYGKSPNLEDEITILPTDPIAAVSRVVRANEQIVSRIETLEGEMLNQISPAFNEIKTWRQIIPNLLNAVSSAQAAASLVSRSNYENFQSANMQELANLKADIEELKQSMKKIDRK